MKMSKETKKAHSNEKHWLKRHKLIVITMVGVALILGTTYGFIGGGFRHLQARIACGSNPVIGREYSKTREKAYVLPTDSSYSSFILYDSTYFCSEQEAVNAGYENFFKSYYKTE